MVFNTLDIRQRRPVIPREIEKKQGEACDSPAYGLDRVQAVVQWWGPRWRSEVSRSWGGGAGSPQRPKWLELAGKWKELRRDRQRPLPLSLPLSTECMHVRELPR